MDPEKGMRIHHQGWEMGISSLMASTYAQDAARTRRAQTEAAEMQQNKPENHTRHKRIGSKDLTNQLPEQHSCIARVLTTNVFAKG